MHSNDDINNRNVQNEGVLHTKGVQPLTKFCMTTAIMQSGWWIFLWLALPVAQPKTTVKND